MCDLFFQNADSRIPVMMHSISFDHKPSPKETASIIKQFRTEWVTINQLAYYLACGRTCRPGILVGGSKTENWQSQQGFFVDIDASNTVLGALKLCREHGLTPDIIYPSFRFTPKSQRFRLVFIASDVIYNENVRDQIQNKLIEIFHSDTATKDRNRIFFGGETCFWADDMPRFDAETFLNKESRGEIIAE
jgi:hypothetical protein